MGRGLVKWLLLIVAVGLVPVLLNLVLAGITDTFGKRTILAVAFGKGELLMLAVGFSAGVIKELLGVSQDSFGLRSAAIGICFLIGVAATGVYAFVMFADAVDFQLTGTCLAVVSLVPYGMSVLISGVCTLVVGR